MCVCVILCIVSASWYLLHTTLMSLDPSASNAPVHTIKAEDVSFISVCVMCVCYVCVCCVCDVFFCVMCV